MNARYTRYLQHDVRVRVFTSNMGGRGEVGCCSVPNVSASYLRTFRPTSSSGFNGVEWGEVGWVGIGWGWVMCLWAILVVTGFLRIVE